MQAAFAPLLSLASRVRHQRGGQRGPKVYSLHGPEVACIGTGKPHKSYEFGVKVSLATPLHRCAGGQFVAHVAALPGNPYDGHTVIPAVTAQIGVSLRRVIADGGHRGHNAPPDTTSGSCWPGSGDFGGPLRHMLRSAMPARKDLSQNPPLPIIT